ALPPGPTGRGVPRPKAAVGELARELLSGAIEAREMGRGAMARACADRLVELAEVNLNEGRPLATLVGALGRTGVGNQPAPRPLGTRDADFGVNEASTRRTSPPSFKPPGPRAGSRSSLSYAASPEEPSRPAGEEHAMFVAVNIHTYARRVGET